GKFCNRTFDNYVCWPDGIPGTFVNMSCPWYLPSGSSDSPKHILLHGSNYIYSKWREGMFYVGALKLD
ncbi:hypothetical protein Chor_006365, partial [Crotalus horridus]